MKIYEVAHVNNNFGDTLNGWLWRDLRPDVFDGREAPHFVGIGTILDRHLPASGVNVVFGSGTGYAPPPTDLRSPRWRIYGVRGPLTARLLGLPEAAALTDPAILLARHPAFRDRERGGVIFVPHWKSTTYGQWQQACALAGIEFVDPCGDTHAVIRKIAGARKVIAESMHAAIIADTFRVPWTPVLLSREVAPFKWVDWASTVGQPYRPRRLGPSSPVEVLRERVLERSAFAYIGRLPERATTLEWTHDELLRDQAAAVARVDRGLHRGSSQLAEAVLKRMARAAPKTHARVAPGLYRRFRERAAAQLAAVAGGDGHLSDDAAHRHALERCEATLQRLADDHHAGRLAPN